MNFLITANTDIGIKKSTNQDSLTVKTINTSEGRMVFGLLCDGMGGLDKGEVASATVINAFDNWIRQDLPAICKEGITKEKLQGHWNNIITTQNQIIMNYGKRQGIALGTTVVVMLITENNYYVMNVGDSRAYEISDNEIVQITKDQTFIAREIELGNMTEEQAMNDSRRNVLLQCCGASDAVYPDMFSGVTKNNAIYMLCSDGFRHEISSSEIHNKLSPGINYDENSMNQNTVELIELNKSRQEQDNISVVLVRTF